MESKRRYHPVTIPQDAPPIVQFIFTEMNRQRITPATLAKESAVNWNTIKDWRTRNEPTLCRIEAVLKVLGYALITRPLEDKGGTSVH